MITVLSGFGGQGLLFAGQVLAQAGLEGGRHVSWLPSYGPEMRGGTASCTVIVSERPIGSPIADVADVVIALNPPSLARFEGLLRPGGLLVINDSLIETEPARTDIEVLRVPCSAIARGAGDDRVVSIVALGAAMARRPIVTEAVLREGLRTVAHRAGPDAVERNLRALEAGSEAGALVPA
ncbi:MAG TPA: 2-oxoacid:acceptor oxidoreductase family protein [Candidatus Limnocylindrales bacterium]|jgi:2-oxoglutarate ferredoxin oxidoreductase subunit gamma|nr:2-oxoacid:acceptor oxidoreductase family protein [Candidatus Limnocylindrales bacterium]